MRNKVIDGSPSETTVQQLDNFKSHSSTKKTIVNEMHMPLFNFVRAIALAQMKI